MGAAKTLHPAFAKYVADVVALEAQLPPRNFATGLCAAMENTELRRTNRRMLQAFVEGNRHAFDYRSLASDTPFNCAEQPDYYDEGTSGGRLTNPYRRAFINWVCRLADKPELLP